MTALYTPGAPVNALSGVGGGSVSVDPSTWLGTVFRAKGDDVAGNDGDLISVWVPARDTGAWGNLTSAGGSRPTLKKGVNGINGHAVARYSGAQKVATAPFGAQLTGDYAAWWVGKITASIGPDLSVTLWNVGDVGPAAGKGREVVEFGVAATTYTIGYDTAGGQSTFFPSVDVRTAGQAVLVIKVIQQGKRCRVYVNGALVIARASRDYSAFANGVLTLGSLGFGLNADLAEFTIAAVPTAAQEAAYDQYLYTTYGAIEDTDGGFARFTAAGVADEVSTVQQNAAVTSLGITAVGGHTPLQVGGGTSSGFEQDATLSVHGPVAIVTEQQEALRVENGWGGFNVHSTCSTSPAGYSVGRWLRYTREEMGAEGYFQPGQSPYGGPLGSIGKEFSNFHDTSPAKFGDGRWIQTMVNTPQLRMWLRGDTQTIQFFDDTWTEPTTGGPAPGLTFMAPGPKQAVANNGTFNTTIPTGTAACVGTVRVVNATTGKIGVWNLFNTTLTAAFTLDAEFSTAQGTAGKTNVYASGGQVVVENKLGGSNNYSVSFMR